jgi:RHS repeat-associated protein
MIDYGSVVAESDEGNNALAGNAIQVTYVQADLAVSAVSGPATGTAGTVVPVSFTVSSAAGASQAFTSSFAIYLSTDATITTADTRVYATNITLSPGQSYTGNVNVTLPGTLATGTYYVGAMIDYGSVVAEPDETNNALAGNAIQVTYVQADLAVNAVSGPASVNAGGVASVSFTASSASGASQAFTSLLGIYVSTDATITAADTRIYTTNITLSPGQTYMGNVNVTIPATLADGTYYVGAIIDAGSAVAESDETNNALAGNAVLVHGPDLVVSAIAGAANAAVGASITLSDTVATLAGATGTFRVGYYLSDDAIITTSDRLIGYRDLALGAAGTSSGSKVVALPAGLSGGFYIGAIADIAGVVAETNEGNNSLAGNLIQIGADLTPPQIVYSGVANGEVTDRNPVNVCWEISDANLAASTATLDGVPALPCEAVVLEGSHTLYLYGRDQAGNESSQAVSFVLDFQDPTIDIAGVSADGVIDVPSLTPSFSAQDDNLLSVTALLDGGEFVSGTPVTGEGDHRLVVTATDRAGHVETAEVSFAIDRTAPRIEIGGVTPGQVSRLPLSPIVNVVEAHPGSLTVTLDGAPWNPGSQVEGDGPHTLVATAVDVVGHSSTETVTFAIDKVAPSVSISEPKEGALLEVGNVVVAVSATDTGGIASVVVSGVGCLSYPDGLYRATVPLAEGSNLLEAVVTDMAGNEGRGSVTVFRDSAAPSLTIVSPQDGARIAGSSVTISGSVDDLLAVTLTVAGQAVAIGPEGTWEGVAVLAAGPNTVEVVATDALGHEARQSLSLRASTTAPTLVVGEPSSGLETGAPSVTVRGTVTPSDSTDSVSVTVNAAPATVGSGGAFEALVELSTGSNTISVVATDGYGLTSSKSLTVVRSDDPPALTLSLPTEGLVVNGNCLVSGTVAKGAPPVKVTVGALELPVSGGSFYGSVPLEDGSRAVTVVATDALGRSASVTRNVLVDATPPSLELTRPGEPVVDTHENPYQVEGTVGDVNLTTVTVNGERAQVLAGRFSSLVPVQVGANAILVEARDAAGHSTVRKATLNVASLPPTIAFLEPLDGSEASTAEVQARVTVSASASIAAVSIGGVTAVGAGSEWTATVPLALGENVLTASVTDVDGQTAVQTIHIWYRDLSVPLTVTGVDPPTGATGVEPDSLVSISFNKGVNPASLAGHFTVSDDRGPLPGGFYVAPGGQTVSFVAQAPLPVGKRLFVRASELTAAGGPGMEGEFASELTVRPDYRRLSGVVLDEQLVALPGVKVSVAGFAETATTGQDGNWTLFDVPAGTAMVRFDGAVAPGGARTISLMRRIFVADQGDTDDEPLVLVAEDTDSAVAVDGTQPVSVAFEGRNAGLALSLDADGLFFADGRTSGTLVATEIPPIYRPVPIDGDGPLGGLWHLGMGIATKKPVTLSLPNRAELPAGTLTVLVTYDPARQMLQRTGIGRVSADGVTVTSDRPVSAKGLDLVGYMILSDEQIAALRKALDDASSPSAPATGGDGTTGLLERMDVGTALAAIFDVLSPLGARPARAADTATLCVDPTDTTNCYSPFGMLDGVPGVYGSSYVHGTIRTSYLAETSTEPVSFFQDRIVEAQGATKARGVTGDYGQFSIPVRTWGPWADASVKTEIDLGTRYQAQRVPRGDGTFGVSYRQLDSKHVLMANAYRMFAFWGGSADGLNFMVGVNAFHRADLIVDLRVLKGMLRFKDRKGNVLAGTCDSSAATARGADGQLTSISAQDVGETEVYFFREANESVPVARVSMGIPASQLNPCAEDPEAAPAHGSYLQVRVGPSDPNRRRQLEDCSYYAANPGKIVAHVKAWFDTECKAAGDSTVRLKKGEVLKVVAVNHATGYTGMGTVTVPGVTEIPPDCEETSTQVKFIDYGQIRSVSSCAVQNLAIPLDIDLYPPELDVRVRRKAKDDGLFNPYQPTSFLVRNGGQTTTRDQFLQVTTHWRVRVAPEPDFVEADVPTAPAAGDTDAPSAKYDLTAVGVDGPGTMLEVPCSTFKTAPSGARLERCTAAEATLAELPVGVTPLAGQLVRVTGTAVERPNVSVFAIRPGLTTGALELGTYSVTGKGGASPTQPPLEMGNYYVHVVGHSLFANDDNQDGQITPDELEKRSPPPPALENYSTTASGAPAGPPVRALTLKDVYTSLETDGTELERFDRSLEHEFRVVDLAIQKIAATVPGDEPRRLAPAGTEEIPAAKPTDLSYQFLASMLAPTDPTRSGTLSGTYQMRLAADGIGIDCELTSEAASTSLTADCGGPYLFDVISASDIVYMELFLSGNADNVLYRFNFQGLAPRTDLVTSGKQYLVEKATAREAAAQFTAGRGVARVSQALFFLVPDDIKNGTVEIASEGGERRVLKRVTLAWTGTEYTVTEQGGEVTLPLTQTALRGVADARQFALPLPNDLVNLQGAEEKPVAIVVTFQDDAKPEIQNTLRLGNPRGEFLGTNAAPAGHETLGGVDVADGHVSFEEEDFSLPEYTSRVRFARAYNNLDNEPGPMGAGWRHSFEGYVHEEVLGRYTVVLGGQSYEFRSCTTTNKEDRTAKDCVTDNSHGGRLEVTRQTGKAAVAKLTTAYGMTYVFDRFSVRAKPLVQEKPADGSSPEAVEGRRRWVLTAFEDGHAIDKVNPRSKGWTVVDYLPDSDMVSSAARVGGLLTVSFVYEDPAPEGSLGLLARRENLKLLKSVLVGTTTWVEFAHDLNNGQLLTATRRVGEPTVSSSYTYWKAPSGLSLGDVTAASNEMEVAERRVGGAAQWRATYGRAGGQKTFDYMARKFEVVDSVILPGYDGAPFKITYAGLQRTVERPDGVNATLTVNPDGNVKLAKLPISSRTTEWGSDSIEGKTAPTQVKSGSITRDVATNDRLLPLSVNSSGSGSAVKGCGGACEQTFAPDATYGSPTSATRPTWGGTATTSRTLNAQGDPTSVSLSDSEFGTLASSAPVFDEDGRLLSETDGVGRTITYSGHNGFGLPTAGAVTTQDVSYNLTYAYDEFGRRTSVSDSYGRSETTEWDAAGRIKSRSVAGSPGESWSWGYTEGDLSLTVTESRDSAGSSGVGCAPAAHDRTLVYEGGRLVSETFAYGCGGNATRGWTYDKGRLTSSTDERGSRTYGHDAEGRVTSVTISGEGGSFTRSDSLDSNGNVTSTTDWNGLTTQISYDALGRESGREYLGGPSHVVGTTRDFLGSVGEVSAGSHVVTMQPDAGGVARKVTGKGLATIVARDAAGRVTKRTDEETGAVESFTYDGRDTVIFYSKKIATRTGDLVLSEIRTPTYGPTTSIAIVRTVPGSGGSHQESETRVVDARGRLLSVTRPVGDTTGTWAYQYDERGNLIVETLPNGSTIRRSYDALGRLLAAQDAAGNVTTYTIAADGLVERQVGPRAGEDWSWTYDAVGQVTGRSIATAGTTPGATWIYTYKPGGIVEETGPEGYKVVRYYDAAYRLWKEERGSEGQQVVTYVYDGERLASQTTQEGGWELTVAVSEDDRGRTLNRSESWSGGGLAYAYSESTPWSKRSATYTATWTMGSTESRSGSLEADSLGNIVSRSVGSGTDTWLYGPTGELLEAEPYGQPKQVYTNVGGLPTQVVNGTETTSYTYWSHGYAHTITDPTGRVRTLGVDGRGQVTSDVYGSQSLAFSYDGAGNLASRTVNGAVWTLFHGPRGELQSVTEPGDVTFTYAHDALARLTAITPPAGGSPKQEFGYDSLGREASRSRGSSTWTTVWSGGEGTTTAPNGDVVTTLLDGRGRTARVGYAPGSESVPGLESVAYAYDGLNQLLKVAETGLGASTTTFAYGDRSELLSVTRGDQAVSYGYDSLGRLEQVTSPSGQVGYGYESGGMQRVSQITGPHGTTEVGWNPGGELATLTTGGYQELRCYDGTGRIQEVLNGTGSLTCGSRSSSIEAGYAYTYDARGNRLSETTFGGGSGETTTRYGYDGASRLTGVQYGASGSAAVLYKLALDGTRLGEKSLPTYAGPLGPEAYDGATGAAQDLAYAFDGQGGLTTVTDAAAGGATVATYASDANGRVKSETRTTGYARTYAWDAASRLRTVQVATPSAPTATITYAYDGRGLRTSRQGAGGTTNYYWGASELAEESGSSHTTIYSRLGSLAVAAGYSALMHDGLGSVVGPMGSSPYQYDAWGGFRSAARPGVSSPSAAYAGQHWDDEAGLSYAQQRWYEPGTGRFLSQDPLAGDPGSPASLLTFGYANGNPTGFVDPTGERAPNAVDQGQIDFLQFLIDRERAKSWLDRSWIGMWMIEDHLSAFKSAVATALEDEPIHFVPFDASPAFRPELSEFPGSRFAVVGHEADLDQIAVEVWGSWLPEGNISWVDSPWRGVRACALSSLLRGETGRSCDPRPGQGGLDLSGSSELTVPALSDGVGIAPSGRLEAQYGAQPYRNFSRRLPSGWQANHLNQDAAFRNDIPSSEGLTVPMFGDAIQAPGTQHYQFHRYLEGFWSQFRRGGSREGERPTNGEYGRALEEALVTAGFPAVQARAYSADAARQREQHGLRESELVPRVPDPLNQVMPVAGTRVNLLSRPPLAPPPPGIRIVPGGGFARPPLLPPARPMPRIGR